MRKFYVQNVNLEKRTLKNGEKRVDLSTTNRYATALTPESAIALGKALVLMASKKSPVTIQDVVDFIDESRESYGLKEDWPNVEDLWECGDMVEITEAARQEGRDEILFELGEYLKRGN